MMKVSACAAALRPWPKLAQFGIAPVHNISRPDSSCTIACANRHTALRVWKFDKQRGKRRILQNSKSESDPPPRKFHANCVEFAREEKKCLVISIMKMLVYSHFVTSVNRFLDHSGIFSLKPPQLGPVTRSAFKRLQAKMAAIFPAYSKSMPELAARSRHFSHFSTRLASIELANSQSHPASAPIAPNGKRGHGR